VNAEASAVVVELAKELITLVLELEPRWQEAFFRFAEDKALYGSTASFIWDSKVEILSVFQHRPFFTSMNQRGQRLLRSLGRQEGLFLLVARSDFNYQIKFEFNDLNRWPISKLNGGTGVPEEID